MTERRRTRRTDGGEEAPDARDTPGRRGTPPEAEPVDAPNGVGRHPPRPARWVPIATYPAVYAAEIGRAVLEAGGFDAIVEGGEHVGIFGPGFSGPTPRGVRVLVPSDQLAAARTYLAFRARDD